MRGVKTMRPMKLTFEGINSFEKRQAIDFKRLTEAHLFGIFGPTGAGKSTILDAMTLALYGEVVRASHNTRGIMNTRCDNLFVEFEFSLGDGDVLRVYRVMRQYSRERDKNERESSDTLKVKKCSLCRIDGEDETVLSAEKSSDVTQKVQKLLGLTMDDFIHSVVLPQGQFAEFLNMKGKDRRDMLERLFHLEAFGKQLVDRVHEREQSVALQAGKVDAALKELGDVSEQTLKEALVRRELDKEELAKVEHDSEAADREAEGLKVLYERIQERKQWQVRKIEHDAARTRISALNAELNAAKRAQMVLPLSTQLNELNNDLTVQRREKHDSERAYENARDYNEKVNVEADSRKPQFTRQKQELQKKIGALETLMPRQAEIDRMNEDNLNAQRRLAEIKQRDEDNERALSEKQAAMKKGEEYVAQQEKLAAECATLDMDKLSRGTQLERDMEERQTRYADALSKLNTCTEALNKVTIELEAAKQREQEGLKALNDAKHVASQAEDSYVRACTLHAAAGLAVGLADGQPCPVCGSVHHPAPAQDDAEIIDERENKRKVRDEKQNEYSNIVREIAGLAQARDTFEQNQTELQKQVVTLRNELSDLTAQWETLCRETGISSMRNAYAAALEKQRNAMNVNRQLIKEREKLDSYRRQVSGHEMERLKLCTEAGRLNDLLKDNQRAVSGWAGELRRLEIPVGADITTALEDCKKHLEHIDHMLEKTDAAIKDAGRRLDDSRRKADEQRAKLEEMQRQRDIKSEQLQKQLVISKFESVQSAQQAFRNDGRISELERVLKEDESEQLLIETNMKRLAANHDEREITDAEMSDAKSKAENLRVRIKELTASLGALETRINDMDKRLKRRSELEIQSKKLRRELDSVTDLKQVLRGNALVEYVANQYLEDITRMAGERLMFLTGKRYNLELGGDGFSVRDMEKGGAARATSTLSGGETFLVSLALALSLSLHINLRGRPLGFFFLDEGFGTLDEHLLGTVMEALTMLARDNFSIGVISHVSALKERIPAQLIVASGPDGSRAHVEFN